MRIGINTFALGSEKVGAGKYISRLVVGLASLNSDIEYVVFMNRNNAREFLFLPENVRKINCGLLTQIRPLRAVWEQSALPLHIRRWKIDVFHSPLHVAPILLSSRSVVTIHDMTLFSLPAQHIRTKRLYFSKLMPFIARKADKIIADSECSKRDIMRILKIPETKIKVIYLGVDGVFRPIKDPRRLVHIRRKYQIVSNFILYAGVLEPRKNLGRLIKAFHKLRQEKKLECQLVIAGKKGWSYSKVFQLVEDLELGRDVIFTGYVSDDDLVLLYNAAELFVYPSLYEGFGLPPLEAMACGTPVIASNVSSLPEVVSDAGLLVNPYDERGIGNAIYEALTNEGLRKEMGEKGLRRARLFLWEKTARETLQVYQEVLDSS